MEYLEKLKDPRWQKKRLLVFDRDNFSCKKCGFDSHTLVVHHIKYYNEPWDSDINDLDTLCVYCHAVIEWNKRHYTFNYQDFIIDKFINTKGGTHTKVLLIYSFNEYFCIDTLDNNCNVLSTMRTDRDSVKMAIKKHLTNG